ncbi:MAG TPA: DNA/RNA non-specific endonuclease [Pyrinomonadaceae bacterium]|nr:DNA/RNA non-specific endonuclease [Pyrinomonadaceae bacterium]
MTKLYIALLAVVIGLVAFGSEPAAVEARMASPDLVISQFQAGGTSNANDEFTELHNTSSAPVDLNGYRLVYRSDNGVNDVNFAAWTASTIIPPGGYYLIASNAYTGSVTPNFTYVNATCQCGLAAAAGGLAIRRGAVNSGVVIDAVGWGTGSNIFFEGTRTTAPGNSNSKIRLQQGCQDTDNNAADFATAIGSAPRNASTTPVVCGTAGTTLFAAINANPTTIAPPGTTLITVTTSPATNPLSTGITVVGDLSNVGGPGSQPFFDNGTNGDVTAGDGVFSITVTFPAGTPGGSRIVTAVASDAQGRTVNLTQSILVDAAVPNEDPLNLGNPSGATADVANENNYLMHKPQYSLSYNRSKATPNWVAWRLDSSWIGTVERQDDFRPDPALPAGWYQVTPQDYSEPVYDRGHMVPSGDRTNTIANNSATFLMTNMVPQIPANNQGPWEDFEVYLRTLAGQGNEIFVVAGPVGNIGTIGMTQQNRIVVPSATWKVVLILPNGTDDLQRASSRATRAFGLIVPNQLPLNQNDPWRPYRVTVDAVEYLTGYDFFSQIPKNTQELIERTRDVQ